MLPYPLERTMTSPSILSYGEVLWDIFPDGPRFGGAPANFACHAARLGAKVSILSALGIDARGDGALAILRRFGVDTSLVQRTSDAATGAVSVLLDKDGKPTFRIEPGAAWDRIDLTPEAKAAAPRAGAIYFGTLSQRSAVSRETLRHLLTAAKSRGTRRVFDVNLRSPFHDPKLVADSIRLASVLKLSSDEIEGVAQATKIPVSIDPVTTLRALRERHGLELIAMTCGADGAVLVSAHETIRQPGIPTIVRDTVGAGDAFTAALTVGLLRGHPLARIARDACELAAATCAHAGALPECSDR